MMGETGLSFRVNPLFLLIALLFALVGMLPEVIIAFTIVFCHELAHLITAIKSGYQVRKIELFPFGGLAEYNGLLEMEPWQEFKVALAGPAFNLSLALVIWIIIKTVIAVDDSVIILIFKYSILLGAFNLIPALPLDGGRMLRALLVAKMGFRRGTYLSIRIAKWLAFIGGVLCLSVVFVERSSIWFLLLAFFVYGAALREEKQFIYLLINYLTHRDMVVKKMKSKPGLIIVMKGELPIREAVYFLNPVKYNFFYILDHNLDLAGIVSETRLINTFFRLKDKEMRLIELI